LGEASDTSRGREQPGGIHSAGRPHRARGRGARPRRQRIPQQADRAGDRAHGGNRQGPSQASHDQARRRGSYGSGDPRTSARDHPSRRVSDGDTWLPDESPYSPGHWRFGRDRANIAMRVPIASDAGGACMAMTEAEFTAANRADIPVPNAGAYATTVDEDSSRRASEGALRVEINRL